MSPAIYRLRVLMVRMGDLPDVEADASRGLSNGAIMERLQEICHPQDTTAHNKESSEGGDE